MLLACDIGNSYISFGFFEAHVLKETFKLSTKKKASSQDYLKFVKPKIDERFQVNKLIIASVVPEVTGNLASALELLLGIEPKVLTNKDIPVVNKYSEPDKVGADRLLNAYAGIKLYKVPLIIVDFGTATTFDVMSDKGEYLGGAIVPGVETSLEALFGKASKLEEVELKKPSESIGHSTKESIRSGTVIGTAGLVDKIICEIEKDLGPSARIATGGLASLIIPYCEMVNKIDKNLTLKAIALLSETDKKAGS